MLNGPESEVQFSAMTRESGSRLRWWHKIDIPTTQVLTADESIYARLTWPDKVRHHGSPAVGASQEGVVNFAKGLASGGTVRILKDNAEVGQITINIGRPSQITLVNGHGYSLRNEGFLREEWVLVDENNEPLFRVKRIFPDVEVSGEVEFLGEGSTEPPMPLLMMAAWYAVQ